MRNYIKLLTVITVIFFMYSCSNEQKPKKRNDNLPPKSEEVNNEKAEIVDPEVVEIYDFRFAKWGMSKEEVMESERTEPVLKSDNTLDYSIIIMKMQTQIGYTFKDNELIRAGFFFLTKPETKNEYIDNYVKIKEELIKVNGEPVVDTIKQKTPSKKIDPFNIGQAVCDGDMIYASQWDLPGTAIQLVLRGEDSECILTILYLSEEGMRQRLEDSLKKQES